MIQFNPDGTSPGLGNGDDRLRPSEHHQLPEGVAFDSDQHLIPTVDAPKPEAHDAALGFSEPDDSADFIRDQAVAMAGEIIRAFLRWMLRGGKQANACFFSALSAQLCLRPEDLPCKGDMVSVSEYAQTGKQQIHYHVTQFQKAFPVFYSGSRNSEARRHQSEAMRLSWERRNQTKGGEHE